MTGRERQIERNLPSERSKSESPKRSPDTRFLSNLDRPRSNSLSPENRRIRDHMEHAFTIASQQPNDSQRQLNTTDSAPSSSNNEVRESVRDSWTRWVEKRVQPKIDPWEEGNTTEQKWKDLPEHFQNLNITDTHEPTYQQTASQQLDIHKKIENLVSQHFKETGELERSDWEWLRDKADTLLSFSSPDTISLLSNSSTEEINQKELPLLGSWADQEAKELAKGSLVKSIMNREIYASQADYSSLMHNYISAQFQEFQDILNYYHDNSNLGQDAIILAAMKQQAEGSLDDLLFSEIYTYGLKTARTIIASQLKSPHDINEEASSDI